MYDVVHISLIDILLIVVPSNTSIPVRCIYSGRNIVPVKCNNDIVESKQYFKTTVILTVESMFYCLFTYSCLLRHVLCAHSTPFNSFMKY